MYTNCINYECNEALPDHSTNNCGKGMLGGISGTVLLECNHQLDDPSDAAQIAAEIAAGRAKLINGVKIGLDQPSPVETPSFIVGGTDQISTYNRSGTIKDGNVSEANNSFYSTLFSGRVFGGAIMYIKGSEQGNQGTKILFVDAAITFQGGLPVKDNNDENLIFNGIFKWTNLDAPTLLPAPTGIF